MKTVELSKGQWATVDDEDFERVNALVWHAITGKAGNFYARHTFPRMNGIRKSIYLHRFVLNIEDDDVRKVDHKNGDGLDNRSENLRIVSNRENCRNKHRLRSNNESGYRCVHKMKKDTPKPFWSYIKLSNGKRKYLGSFVTAEEAAKAFDEAAKKEYGEFCGKLNFE